MASSSWLMKNTYFSWKCLLYKVSTLLTPGSDASRLPTSPRLAAIICNGNTSNSISHRADFIIDDDFFIVIVLL